uniref:Uncharacterized protein n=1 Tax=Mimivirus LCMiAC02 TaxID=2506609 RepID=A0A4V1A6F9_9VIRU|nr:MAG: hypothetical protein LCMiAC02_04880 [Mimivirus LCMiAC02]
MNNKSKPYNIHDSEWIDSIYVGYTGSISPPAFASYQSSRTKKKFISNNSKTNITTSSTSKIIVSKIRYKNKKKKYYTISDYGYPYSDSDSNSDFDQTDLNSSVNKRTNSQTRFDMSQQQSLPATCCNCNSNCCILTVGCVIFFILLIFICIITGIIMYMIKIVR